MDTIQLMKAIEEKRKLAQIQVEEIIPILEENKKDMIGNVLDISYRIKGKESILEKIKYKKNKQKDLSEEQILDNILDIIGITVEVGDFENSIYVARQIAFLINEKRNEIENNFIIYLNEDLIKKFQQYNNKGSLRLKTSETGFEGISLHYNSEGKVGYEIQVTDKENIRIREETHEEFKRMKYKEIRNRRTNTEENRTGGRKLREDR